jgi:hypothetical protein
MSIGDKVTGYFLRASRAGAADGLRSALAECGVDELIPELFETEFEEDETATQLGQQRL